MAAVLLYRILSFWAELPLGWATWGVLAWWGRPVAISRRIGGDGHGGGGHVRIRRVGSFERLLVISAVALGDVVVVGLHRGP